MRASCAGTIRSIGSIITIAARSEKLFIRLCQQRLARWPAAVHHRILRTGAEGHPSACLRDRAAGELLRYIPTQVFDFILRNFAALRELGALEEVWLDAHIFQNRFADYGLETVKAVFDACDRSKLQTSKPINAPIAIARQERVSLFRGCAGPVHHMGMSWTSSLDKAIWYAAHEKPITIRTILRSLRLPFGWTRFTAASIGTRRSSS